MIGQEIWWMLLVTAASSVGLTVVIYILLDWQRNSLMSLSELPTLVIGYLREVIVSLSSSLTSLLSRDSLTVQSAIVQVDLTVSTSVLMDLSYTNVNNQPVRFNVHRMSDPVSAVVAVPVGTRVLGLSLTKYCNLNEVNERSKSHDLST
jgi:hypothetical protein